MFRFSVLHKHEALEVYLYEENKFGTHRPKCIFRRILKQQLLF